MPCNTKRCVQPRTDRGRPDFGYRHNRGSKLTGTVTIILANLYPKHLANGLQACAVGKDLCILLLHSELLHSSCCCHGVDRLIQTAVQSGLVIAHYIVSHQPLNPGSLQLRAATRADYIQMLLDPQQRVLPLSSTFDKPAEPPQRHEAHT